MKVLVDTNINLDYLLQREPFCQDANLLFQAIAIGQIEAHVTATTVTDIFYISRRYTQSLDLARQAVAEILSSMAICAVDRAVLEAAYNANLADFEGAVQIYSAVAQQLEAIITRDTKGFTQSPIPYKNYLSGLPNRPN